MNASAADVVREYYDALRRGDPLAPYFLAEESTVKFGISEALFGYDEVAEALREQTETTDGWSVESASLVVEERGPVATFADEVTMAWTDVETGDRRRFETRWSGTLVRVDEAENGDESEDGPDWRFAAMHVSTAGEL